MLDIEMLKKLMRDDPDKFMGLVLSILKTNPELVMIDATPKETKLASLTKMIKRYEELEKYEDCGFLKGLKDKLASEG
jgi:hypothetical protein